jgi:hypothetical protein
MIPAKNGRSALFLAVVRFLRSNQLSDPGVMSLVEDANMDDIAAAFSFLGNWFTSHFHTCDEPSRQAISNLAIQVGLRVSVPTLFVRMRELRWPLNAIDKMCNRVYSPVLARIRKLRDYLAHFYTKGCLFGYDAIFDDSWKGVDFRQFIELESDSHFQNTIRRHFRRLIVNRVSLPTSALSSNSSTRSRS